MKILVIDERAAALAKDHSNVEDPRDIESADLIISVVADGIYVAKESEFRDQVRVMTVKSEAQVSLEQAQQTRVEREADRHDVTRTHTVDDNLKRVFSSGERDETGESFRGSW